MAGGRGLDPRQWPTMRKGEGTNRRASERARGRGAACKMHNIVKFHYRYNNASLIRRAMRRARAGPVPLNARPPYDVPGDPWTVDDTWIGCVCRPTALRHEGRKPSRALVTRARLSADNYRRRVRPDVSRDCTSRALFGSMSQRAGGRERERERGDIVCIDDRGGRTRCLMRPQQPDDSLIVSSISSHGFSGRLIGEDMVLRPSPFALRP